MPSTGRYLILVEANCDSGPDRQDALEGRIKDLGLIERCVIGHARLLTSSNCPVLALTPTCCVIGDVYSRQGQHIRSPSQLPELSNDSEYRAFFIAELWGEYIMLSASAAQPHSVTVLRSPSHACELACLWLEQGKRSCVTSDISLATGLGLLDRSVDMRSIAHRLVYPELKNSRTLLTGVSELLPGHELHLESGKTHIHQRWNPWDFVGPDRRHRDSEIAALALRNAVETTIRALASRDSTVLVELSGGLDSSVVAACLRNSGAAVHCSTYSAPGLGSNEADYASLVAAMLGVELSVAMFDYDGAGFDFTLSERAVNAYTGPLQRAADSVMWSEANRVDAESTFSGAGGDTVFGYLSNASPAADAFLAAGPAAGLRAIRDLAEFHQCTFWKAARLTAGKLSTSKALFRPDLRFLVPGIDRVDPELHPWHLHPATALPGERQRIFDLAACQSFQDACPRAPFRPVRMPLLSQPVIETCLRVPSWMWFMGGQNRAIARLAFSDVLPSRIIERRSKGTFGAFLGALYRRKKLEILAFLIDGELAASRLLDADALRAFVAYDDGRGTDAYMRLFDLCALENWLRQQPSASPRYR